MGAGGARQGPPRFPVGRRGCGAESSGRRGAAPERAVGHGRPGVAVDIGLVRRVATVPRVARVLCQPSSFPFILPLLGQTGGAFGLHRLSVLPPSVKVTISGAALVRARDAKVLLHSSMK